jgi:hypothetical protein
VKKAMGGGRGGREYNIGGELVQNALYVSVALSQ